MQSTEFEFRAIRTYAMARNLDKTSVTVICRNVSWWSQHGLHTILANICTEGMRETVEGIELEPIPVQHFFHHPPACFHFPGITQSTFFCIPETFSMPPVLSPCPQHFLQAPSPLLPPSPPFEINFLVGKCCTFFISLAACRLDEVCHMSSLNVAEL